MTKNDDPSPQKMRSWFFGPFLEGGELLYPRGIFSSHDYDVILKPRNFYNCEKCHFWKKTVILRFFIYFVILGFSVKFCRIQNFRTPLIVPTDSPVDLSAEFAQLDQNVEVMNEGTWLKIAINRDYIFWNADFSSFAKFRDIEFFEFFLNIGKFCFQNYISVSKIDLDFSRSFIFNHVDRWFKENDRTSWRTSTDWRKSWSFSYV